MKNIGQTHLFFMAIILNLDSKDMTAEMVTFVWTSVWVVQAIRMYGSLWD
ncbi:MULTISPECIES: hypothetical protein [unclassified Shewanella]|nr:MULTISPECIES: hypothetical protein [unclassified Shewanella]MBW3516211.1 hypothetical protein [Shewanella sp. NKUCC01_JLK]